MNPNEHSDDEGGHEDEHFIIGTVIATSTKVDDRSKQYRSKANYLSRRTRRPKISSVEKMHHQVRILGPSPILGIKSSGLGGTAIIDGKEIRVFLPEGKSVWEVVPKNNKNGERNGQCKHYKIRDFRAG